jgi:metal-responsive CopG/Arc/MetJ family transcriptional regulator
MSDKAKIMSVSLSTEMYDLVKETSKKLGHKNVSLVFRELISKYLNLLLDDNETIPVMIKIPSDLVDNEDELKSWLHMKSEAIANALCKNQPKD